MKKLPLFAWDKKEQRYVRFPYHLLQTFADGSVGFYWDGHLDAPCVETIVRFSAHFMAHYATNKLPGVDPPDGYVLKSSIVTNDTKEQK